MAAPMEFDFRFGGGRSGPAPRRREDAPMRILVMGDLSGRENRSAFETGDALASRGTPALDVDNFDRVMARLAPALTLSLPGGAGTGIHLDLARLDDFHPDELFRRLPLFEALRRTRERLLDPETFPAAAAELRQAARELPSRSAPEPSPDSASADEDDAATVERLLGRPAGSGSPSPRVSGGTVDIDAFVRSLVAPYVTPGPDPFQPQYVAWVDEAIAAQMRALLHHPAFQALESAWRSLQFLVSRLETGEELRLHLLDVSRAELISDLSAAGDDPGRSAVHRLLVDKDSRTLGGEPWSLLVGCYGFGPGEEDVALLAALGALASRAGGPFLAEAHPALLGCASPASAPDPAHWSPLTPAEEGRWRALRTSPAARWIGLALPRILMRLPYGKLTDPVERFAFEELGPDREHASYLWGNPAIGCAMLLGRSWLERGAGMEPGDLLEIEELPAHTWQEGDSSRMKPCAEALLGERATQAILTRGLIPVLSHASSDRARVARFQSIADPPAPLAGPWR